MAIEVKVWFIAIEPTKNAYFTFAYGPRHDEPFVATHHIAYWWSRCAAVLETSTDMKHWHIADDLQQEDFLKLLNIEFLHYELAD